MITSDLFQNINLTTETSPATFVLTAEGLNQSNCYVLRLKICWDTENSLLVKYEFLPSNRVHLAKEQ